LPPVDAAWLADALWDEYRIETPVVEWKGRQLLRVSCHLYTQSWEIDRLADALHGRLP
jgi:selenocysteine lyase/cysteine desulfurase